MSPGRSRAILSSGSTGRHLLLILAVFVLLAGRASGGDQRPAESARQSAPEGKAGIAAGAGRAEDFLVVDCLLPGQIRRLGSRHTYLAARRPTRTSARDCEIRGGEYVAYDRASYATALKVWLPLAEGGDPAAQTHVGEIYQRGLGVPPDYAAAAGWYRRAAEKNYSRAAINLGHLYEQGLGVPKDPKEALKWYRRATGSSDLTFEIVPQGAETEQLKAEIGRLRQALQAKEAELERTRTEVESLRRRLEQRQGEADQERSTLARLRKQLEQLRLTEQAATTRLTEVQQSIRESESRLAAKDREVAELRTSVSQAHGKSTQQREDLDQQVAGLRSSLARAEADATAQRAGLERLRREVAQAGPDIQLVQVQLIEPTLVASRGTKASPPDAGSRAVMLVGRVTTASGLTSLSVAGRDQQLDGENLFRSTIPITTSEQRVRIVAVDQLGRRSTLEFFVPARPVEAAIQPGRGETGQPGRRPPRGEAPLPRLQLGNYHALVIGNNDYRHLPKLRTAGNDAQEVARILKEKYGFQVTLLTNATRYQIMSALNGIREKLTKKDNLLVYYAGHGELDERNQRGHWLPVDAERNSTANWISNDDVSAILNIMEVRQLLLVADSCYAGTLTRSAIAELGAGLSEDEVTEVIKRMAQQRSRMALTSGGLEPVLDSVGGPHSAFAQTFIRLLDENDGMLLGREVFRRLQLQVAAMAQRLRVPQVPEYAPIRFAGHEGGDFIFVRSN